MSGKVLHGVGFGQMGRNKQGRPGAIAIVRTRRGGRVGRYQIPTHGLTPEEFVAKVQARETYHEAKCGRIDNLRVLVGMEFVAGDATFVVTDATIRERGTDTEMLIAVREASSPRRLPGFPLRIVRSSVERLPGNADLVALISEKVNEVVTEREQQSAFEAEVESLMGVE